MTIFQFPVVKTYTSTKNNTIPLVWNVAEISKSKALKEIKDAIKKFRLEGTIDY